MHSSSDFLTFFAFGIFGIAVLQVLIPLAAQLADNLILWLVRRPAARARQWHALDDAEKNLQRASHSIAYIVLPLAAVWLIGPDAVGAFFSDFALAVQLFMIGACAVCFVVAVARCVGGWQRCAGVSDGFLAALAFFRLVIGVGLLVLLHHQLARWDMRYGALELALFVAPLWLAVTGLVRFVILVRPAGSALPEVETNIADNEFDWNE